MANFKRPALVAGIFWLVPLFGLLLLRGDAMRAHRGSAWRGGSRAAGRIGRDGQVRSPSPPVAVAALATLPYILQSVDSDRTSGVVRHAKGRVSPGLNFFFPWSWKPPRAILMDLDGKIVWQWSLADHVRGQEHPWLENALLLPDGCVLFTLEDRGIVKVDRDSRVVWEAPLRVHHDLWPAEDGRFYALTHALEVVPDIHPALPIESDAVSILSPEGKVLERIRILDLLRDSGYAYLLPRLQSVPVGPEDKVLDVFHLNHVEVLDGSLAARSPIYRKGNLLISLRNLSLVGIVDRASRKLVWIWGPGNLTFQHDPRMLPNGDVLVFDNGTTSSQIVEVDPLSDRVTWRWAPESGFFSSVAGAVERLPNGNTLITESMAGHVIEVDPRGETVWRYSNPEIDPKGLRNGIIRMTRVDPATLTFLGSPPAPAGALAAEVR